MPTSFLDKTFQVRFHVPPLILKDWMDFLKKGLSEAMPDHLPAEFHPAARVFQVACGESLPTPRLMKLFINDLGALHLQWCNTGIPLPHLAYYVVQRRKNRDILADLQRGVLDTKGYEALLQDDIADHLCALLYNAEIETARAVAIRNPIENALRTLDHERLKELANSYGFVEEIEILLEQLPERWKSDPSSVGNAANCILDAGLLSSEQMADRVACVSRYANHALQTTNWNGSEPNGNSGIPSLVLIARTRDASQTALNVISRMEIAPVEEFDEPSGDAVSAWARIFVSTVIAIKEAGHSSVFEKGVKLAGTKEQFIAACICLFQEKGETQDIWGNLVPAADPAEIIGIITPRAGTDWPEDYEKVLNVLTRSETAYPWSNMATGIVSTFLGQPSVLFDSTSVVRAVRSLWKIADLSKDGRTALEPLKSNGWLHNVLQIVHVGDHAEAVAHVLFTLIALTDTAKTPPVHGKSAQGFALLRAILDNPSDHTTVVTHFCELLPGWTSASMVRSLANKQNSLGQFVGYCINHLFEKERLAEVISPDDLLEHGEQFRDLCSVDNAGVPSFESFLQHLADQGDLGDKLSRKPFDPEKARLYHDVFQNGCRESTVFSNFLGKGLRETDTEKWISELSEFGNCVQLLLDVLSVSADFRLGSPYKAAHKEFGTKLLGDEAVTKIENLEWKHLIDCIDNELKKVLCRDLRDAMIAKEHSSDTFILRYGQLLLDSDCLADEKVVRRVLSPILRDPSMQQLSWLANVAATAIPFKPAPPSDVAEFDGLLLETWQNSSDDVDARSTLKQIADHRRVKCFEHDEPVESDDQ